MKRVFVIFLGILILMTGCARRKEAPAAESSSVPTHTETIPAEDGTPPENTDATAGEISVEGLETGEEKTVPPTTEALGSVKPTEAPRPTESPKPTKPTESTRPTTPPATEPSTPTKPAPEATEPSTEATEPSVETTEPSTEVTEPSTEATKPVPVVPDGEWSPIVM